MAAVQACVSVLFVGLLFVSLQLNVRGQGRNRALSSPRQRAGGARSENEKWTYNGRQGSSNWWRTYPMCRRPWQSPINIDTCSVYVMPPWLLPPIVLSGYGTVTNTILKNTGASVRLQIFGGHCRLRGGLLNGVFTLDSIHFHWGSNNRVGSEHAINRKRFPLEMHLVHYNSDRFNSKEEAGGKPDGLAALAFFFKVGRFNRPMQGIVRRLKQVAFPEQEMRIPSMSLARLLQARLDRFYTYRGSLTTPPCFRHVTWTVFPTPIDLSQNQMDVVRSAVLSNEMKSAADNYRPHQPLLGRRVLANHPSLKSTCRVRPLRRLGIRRSSRRRGTSPLLG